MKRTFLKTLVAGAATLMLAAAGSATAGPISERIEAGQPLRIGFANEVPWAYPGEGNKPLGFVNAIALGVLAEMGHTDVEPVVTEWGGLIPGIKANRFDIITGGMYILAERCRNIAFSDPIGKFGDAFIVAKGNPKGLSNYQDLKDKQAIFVTGAGFNTVPAARREGVPDSQVMQVPGPTEILAAVRAGRADAGGVTYFTALNLAKESGGAVEVTDPAALPDWTLNWVGIGFRESDADFVARFNEALGRYLGTPKMMQAVAEYGYTDKQLPGDQTTEWVCANR